MISFDASFTVPTSVAAGPAVDVRSAGTKWVDIEGTFVGTLSVQGSFDGSHWFDHQTGIASTTTAVQVSPPYRSLRINVTAYTSGQPTAVVYGFK